MRLVRLAPQPSRVAEDIRAAVASLGKGSEVAGGIALAGVRPLPFPHTFDAVLVLPRGVLIVLGVDLPEPVMRLEAPLTGPWKADGWPVKPDDKAVNPATHKLALAESLRKHLKPMGVPVGTVLAVGPFVDQVDQPAADAAGMVRVLHPTATSMLAAVVSLASAPKPCTIDEARAQLKLLAPDAPEITAETLAAEGFSRDAPTVTLPKVPAQAPKATPPKPIEITTPVPKVIAAAPVRPTAARPSKTVRWLPLGAIGMLAVLLVVAIVLATTGGDSGDQQAAPANQDTPAVQVVNGIQFIERASASDSECASHAFGDVQASLQRSGCVAIKRGSYEATTDGKPAAVAIAVITFANEETAREFKKVADEPGGGGIADIASETGKWPRKPDFDGAAYVSAVQGGVVRLVLVAWFDEASSSSDPGLMRTAHAAAAMQIT
ncbi:hypothetical protein HFP15_29425 [Amycolatopsis sp. K13G38]|uniref:NERD domain-containing protein n=1 Tax=Amycolatopsis acididurans TaxID=2724524 RepID=A0ABX1JB25_9PSEU|nr:hypothetical protein [Amycolatopsis acididurans]NKQ56997.1 hypothetical protein [Amycolatopsis acididurans]